MTESAVDMQRRTDKGPTQWTWITRASCLLWGHRVDNHLFKKREERHRTCPCGRQYLFTDGSETRVRHTLSCFLGHHTYQSLGRRDRHHEYVCVQCGHPLLFSADTDPYVSRPEFNKKVRYLCGLFGHRVYRVTERDGFVEYACGCGHSFLRALGGHERLIRHPMICVLSGHFVRYVTSRGGHSEYVCRNCGHPFCFADPENA